MFDPKIFIARWPALLVAGLAALMPLFAEDAPPAVSADVASNDSASSIAAPLAGSAPGSVAVAAALQPAGSAPGMNDLAMAAATPFASPTLLASTAANTSVASAAATTTPDMSPPAAPTEDAGGGSPTPSESVTINLIHLMVKRGLIAKDDADKLIKQAQDESMAAHEQAVLAAAKGEPSASGPSSNETSPAQSADAGPSPAVAADDDTVRVTYVPEVVKQQLRDEIKQDVMAEARNENWGPSNQIPDWVHRFHVSGDIRVREEGDFYPAGNADAIGDFVNYNAINTGGTPFDVNTTTNPNFHVPSNDVDTDRQRLRLRARIGAGIDLGEGFTAGLRIGTGQDNNPVTENQTVGLANNGQGGNFSKYAVWLDRAFINYDIWGEPDKDISLTIGRFDNPFFSTSMIWANDIGFDGVAVKGKYQVTDGVTPFVTAGFFPVFNTDFNFSSNQPEKFRSEDKYLLGGQTGVTWKINQDFTFLGAVALYDFENIEGKVSDPFIAADSSTQGDTDDSRPSFAQDGNTYIALRDLQQNPALPPGETPDYQYFGLASRFREAALTAQLDFARFDPIHVSLVGEVVKNLAFDRENIINSGPSIDPGPQNNLNDSGSFDGGDTGYYIGVVVGKVALEKLWDWNAGLNYRYVESDSVVDAFTDADFGADLTGTNLQGFSLEAKLALAQRVWLGMRFMSSESIAGPTYENDLVQFDINAKF